MQKSKIQNTSKNIFAIFCFLFISFLLIVVIYETMITQELPTDNDKKEKAFSDKYSFLPKAFGFTFPNALDEDEEFDDESEKHEKGWYD